jgi:hypothetical protein
VTFSFGTVTYSRRCFERDGEYLYPVDDKLGIEPRQRVSKEIRVTLATLATFLPYRTVCEVLELTHGIYLTHKNVWKTLKEVGQLLEEKEDYRYYKDHESDKKITSDVIYIEGDGVMVNCNENDKRVDLAHFLVHTGAEKIGKKRKKLKNKRTIISASHKNAFEKVVDHLHNHFHITKETTFITNSDGGHGYTPYRFKELAKTFSITKHEHFLDAYHLNKKINDHTKNYPPELRDRLFQAIETHNKKDLRLVLDTLESLADTENEIEKLDKFSQKLLKNFQYTKPAKLRGFSHAGIGVMESQHRKITYRMKKRGMYWSLVGVNAMAQLIILKKENSEGIRDLFFGNWRKKYEKFKALESSASDYLKVSPTTEHIKNVKVHHKIARKMNR